MVRFIWEKIVCNNLAVKEKLWRRRFLLGMNAEVSAPNI